MSSRCGLVDNLVFSSIFSGVASSGAVLRCVVCIRVTVEAGCCVTFVVVEHVVAVIAMSDGFLVFRATIVSCEGKVSRWS